MFVSEVKLEIFPLILYCTCNGFSISYVNKHINFYVWIASHWRSKSKEYRKRYFFLIQSPGKILITLEEKRDQEDKLGRAAAQLLTADDTIIQKQEEIRKLQEKISILERNNQDVLYLKSQVRPVLISI